jgi:hypothetical protein
VNNQTNKIEFETKTTEYGLFYFELDNSVAHELIIDHKNYSPEKYYVPKGLRSVYFPILLKIK